MTRESSRVKPAQPGAEPPVAIGTIESQVDIAGEVMRHGQGCPEAVGS